MYNHDSEAQWYFDIFQKDPYPISTYCDRVCQQGSSAYDIYYVREEETGVAHIEEQESAASEQDWSYQVITKDSSDGGNEINHEHANDAEPPSSSTSPSEEHCEGEDLAKKLKEYFSQMVPVPHVPKVNGEIPTLDEATTDHQRLLDRLQLYNLVELKVKGDGNCQFRSLADQLYRSPDHHEFVRKQIIDQLCDHPEVYEGYVPMAYSDYLEKISRNGEWGDHVTLQAAADSYGVKIFVITSFKDTGYIEILPEVKKSRRVLFLSFWAEVHYNSIYPEADHPSSDSMKKKKWWKM